jgi:hypothetical protein
MLKGTVLERNVQTREMAAFPYTGRNMMKRSPAKMDFGSETIFVFLCLNIKGDL